MEIPTCGNPGWILFFQAGGAAPCRKHRAVLTDPAVVAAIYFGEYHITFGPMLPVVLFPLPLVACCSMLVFLLWPWRAKQGALKWFLFAWPVLGWEWTVGIPASPCATARICRHIRYYLTSSDDLSQRWFIACTHLYHSSFDSSQCLITCMPYIRATAVTIARSRSHHGGPRRPPC